MRSVSFRLPDHLLLQLAAEATARRSTKSEVVRASLEETLGKRKKSPSCYDLAKDLVGSIKGLPKDIATNPKYMQGFGE